MIPDFRPPDIIRLCPAPPLRARLRKSPKWCAGCMEIAVARAYEKYANVRELVRLKQALLKEF